MVKKIRKWLEEYQDHLGYLVISIVSLVVTGIYAYYQSDVISLIIFLYFVGDAIYRVNAYFHYKADTLKKIESISYRVKHAGEMAFNQLPMGILLYDEAYEIVWFNAYLKRVFNQDLHDKVLKDLSEQLYNRSLGDEESFKITVNQQTYQVLHMKDERLMYFTDYTEYTELSRKYVNEQPVVGVLMTRSFII